MPRQYKFPEGYYTKGPRPSKYNNIKTEVDGIVFDSRKEARRYSDLMTLQRAGKIHNLKLQPHYPLKVAGRLVCTYIADFEYSDTAQLHGGGIVVEDVKGVRTAVYRIKKKLFEAIYSGFRVVEI